MRLRCLIVDPDSTIHKKFKNVLEDLPGVQVYTGHSFQESLGTIQTQRPNLIIFRCEATNSLYEQFFKLIERLKLRTVVLPLITDVNQDFIRKLLQYSPVVDILTVDAEPERIKIAIKKTAEKLFKHDNKSKYYRGFVGFVGITPSLRERKILNQNNLGIIQNRSIRLAIDFWRKNPTTQMVMLTLNKGDKFSSREDEFLELWEDYELEPWKIAMYEAQNHYLNYWNEAIAADLLPCAIPIMLRSGINDLVPLPIEEQVGILKKISQMRKTGQLEEIIHSMGISFKMESPFTSKDDMSKLAEMMEKQMKIVDEKMPHLVRPPDETGYEDFVPDVAQQSASEMKRMAYTQKSR